MSISINLTHEELVELQRILDTDMTRTLVELRRSTPNSEFKHMIQRRVELMNRMMEEIRHALGTALV